MREPADKFGVLLRELRKKRGIAADKLSTKVGAAKTLVSKWELEPRAVNLKVLQKIADALELSLSERRELFHLADLRGVPPESRHLYDDEPDGGLILFEALLSVPHYSHFYFEPRSVDGDDGGNLVDALGWPLACIAATRDDILNPFTQFEWPQELVDLGVVRKTSPESLIVRLDPTYSCLFRDGSLAASGTSKRLFSFAKTKEAEDPTGPEILDDPGVYRLSYDMACAYRDELFQDRERTSRLVSLIESWEYHYVGPFDFAISLRFKHTSVNERFGFRDVSMSIVDRYARDQLALFLWTQGRPSKSKAPDWASGFGKDEYVALHHISTAGPLELASFGNARHLYDAEYMMRSPTWPYVLKAIRERPLSNLKAQADKEARAELEGEFRRGLLPRSVLVDPLLLATVEGDILQRLLHSGLSACAPRPRPPYAKDVEILPATQTDSADSKYDSGKSKPPTTPKATKKPAATKKRKRKK